MADVFPEVVVAFTSRGERRYRLRADLRAHPRHDGPPEVLAASAAGPAALPVYRPEASGPLAVATGRVFVRFDPALSPEDCEAAIARAGFEVVESPSWAPEAAWVCDPERRVARALAALPRLCSLPGVSTVEPELLRARRTVVEPGAP